MQLRCIFHSVKKWFPGGGCETSFICHHMNTSRLWERGIGKNVRRSVKIRIRGHPTPKFKHLLSEERTITIPDWWRGLVKPASISLLLSTESRGHEDPIVDKLVLVSRVILMAWGSLIKTTASFKIMCGCVQTLFLHIDGNSTENRRVECYVGKKKIDRD